MPVLCPFWLKTGTPQHFDRPDRSVIVATWRMDLAVLPFHKVGPTHVKGTSYIIELIVAIILLLVTALTRCWWKRAVEHQPNQLQLPHGAVISDPTEDNKHFTQKVRVILDCKQSQLSTKAARTHKSVLPRVSDAVQAALALSYDTEESEQVQMFMISIVDAFWLVPLRHAERKYFCAKLKGSYCAFLRTAQGSRGAPLTFSAFIALASRLIRSLISGPQMHRWAREEGRMNVCVDDPIAIIRGRESRIRRVASMVIVGWLLLGFPLAFHKAIVAPTVLWVGITLQVTTDMVRAEVPESKVLELKELILTNLQSNVISCKVLRTLIASVIYVWRPFVQELYSALHSKTTNAPKGCIWTEQVHHSFSWILAVLARNKAVYYENTVLHIFGGRFLMLLSLGTPLRGDGCYPADVRAVCVC